MKQREQDQAQAIQCLQHQLDSENHNPLWSHLREHCQGLTVDHLKHLFVIEEGHSALLEKHRQAAENCEGLERELARVRALLLEGREDSSKFEALYKEACAEVVGF
jgi:hypothetical protein